MTIPAFLFQSIHGNNSIIVLIVSIHSTNINSVNAAKGLSVRSTTLVDCAAFVWAEACVAAVACLQEELYDV